MYPMPDRTATSAIYCGTTVALALIVPSYVVAFPVLVISAACAIAILRKPELAREGFAFIVSVLTAAPQRKSAEELEASPIDQEENPKS